MNIRKPNMLICKMNKDGSVTVMCRSRVVAKYDNKGFVGAVESAENFVKGWFSGFEERARWVSSAAARNKFMYDMDVRRRSA